MYRTGDLASWRADGVLDFAGRVDDQVKVRGFRIELGEIESVLAEHPNVAQAVAAVREDRPGDRRVVAYLVARDGGRLDPAALRGHAAAALPEYMVPSAYVTLDTVPLTVNGKLDRAALPAPAPPRHPAGRGPATEREERLCALFAEVLGQPTVGVDDNFFTLGGHSLLATRLVSRVRAALGVELPLQAVFEAPTVAALAGRLDAAIPVRLALGPAVRPARVPLSPAQQRLWFAGRLDPSSLYNMARALRLTGAVDRAALQAAVCDVVARHESLRTTIAETDTGPYLRIMDLAQAVPEVRFVNTDEAGLGDILRDGVRHVFDLSGEPPLRVTLVCLQPAEHVLLLVTHHIAADGWSLAPFARDLSTAYQARLADQRPQWPELAVQYADFALWHHRVLGAQADPVSTAARQLAFWRTTLDGLPHAIDLPLDRPRPVAASHRGDTVPFTLDAGLHSDVIDLARRSGSTVFMVVQAAIAALLTRLGAGHDIPIGTAVAGRTDDALDDLVGFFVNTLVLRTSTTGDPTFRELITRVRDTDLAAYAHQDIPFERVVEAINPARSLSHHPLFQVMLTFQHDLEGEFRLPGLRARPIGAQHLGAGTAKFDLGFELCERYTTGGKADGMAASLEYASDVFDPSTAVAMAGRLVRLLRAVVSDPDRPIADPDILLPDERRQVLRLWNDTAHPMPADTLPALFAARVRHSPDAVAVICGGERLTYAELDDRVNRLARLLISRGVAPECFVAVLIPRSPDLVVALLAVMKAGGAYLPLEASHPDERIRAMLDDIRPALVLTRGDLAGRVSSDACLVLDAPGTAAALAAASGQLVTDQDRLAPLSPANAAFVVFTSGSTGRPKGVVVEHRSLNLYLAWCRHAYRSVAGRSLVHSPGAFDLTVTGLYAPLTAGGCVRLSDLDSGSAPGQDALAQPTFVKATPSHLPLLMALPPEFSPSQQLVTGGESLMGEVLSEWRSRHPDVTVINEYGPTETTVGCMEFRIEPGDEVPPGVITIGHPIWNTRLYLLDRALRPVPVGVVGELYIAGDLVTRGYYGQPGLTAGRFVADPYSEPTGRMYRSGDLARWRPDGEMEFAGRADNQIKLRGYRIEPGEIEAVLGRHPTVKQAAVIVREDEPGDRKLVAYAVPGHGGASADELSAHLARLLPAYMIPAAVITLDALPVTANGKLDRAALPAPVHATTSGRAPRSPHEEILCGLFAEVLKLPRVGVEDSFFARGGHSLLATKLVSRVRTALGVELPLRAVFESPTVAALAGRLDAAAGARPPLRPMARPDYPQLSPVQHRLWFLHRAEGPAANYNVTFALHLAGRIDLAALEAAIGDVVARHEVLRTTFPEVDGDPYQNVLPPAMARPVLHQVQAEPAGLTELLAQAARYRFDLTAEPPLRATVFRVDEQTHALLLVMHHIAMDGGSEAPLARDLSIAYAARLRGVGPEQPPLPLQYADYAAWQWQWLGAADQADSAMSRQLEYWTKTLRDAPVLVTPPADRQRPAAPSFRGGTVNFTVGPDLYRQIAELASATGTTVFMVLQAALAALLTRMGAGSDVPIGTPADGRSDTELDDLIGPFINTLVLRTDTSGDPSFRELLGRVRESDLAAYAHQDVPFDRVVEATNPVRDMTYHPLFQVMLVFQHKGAGVLDVPGLRAEPTAVDAGVARFDLTVSMTEPLAGPVGTGSLAGEIQYAADLFDRRSAEQIATRLVRLLSGAVAEPDGPVGRLAIMSAAERDRLLTAGTGAVGPVPASTLAEQFEAQVARHPAALAVISGGLRLSFAELNERANRLAHRLIALGAGPRTPVAVLLERSEMVVVASLAAAKAGAAYVPMHPAYPEDRMRLMIKETGAGLLLTDQARRDQEARFDVRVITADDQPSLAGQPTSNPGRPGSPDQLAYVMYTSGSTGTPKGVAVTNRDVSALAADGHWPGGAHARVLMHSSYAFDASTYEIWVPLLTGGAIVVAPPGDLTVGLLDRLITEHRLTAIFLTTALFNLVAAEQPKCFAGLSQVWTGGELVSTQAFERVLGACPDTSVVHVYGPTETTTFAACIRLRYPYRVGGTVPIGAPMSNMRAYVLDGELQPVPAGVPGELYLGGSGVSRGYLNQPAATAERFVADPVAADGTPMYRTGDLVRWDSGAQLEYLGRTDQQVKLRGFRVELGEIERALADRPDLAQVTVVLRADPASHPQLIAYAVPAQGFRPDPSQLGHYLGARLPRYMVPAAFVLLSALPLNGHGKVDKARLPAPPPPRAQPSRAPRSPREAALCALFGEVLGLPRVGVEDDFFDLGGHSLLATRLISRVRSVCGLELSVRDVFECPTAAELAGRCTTAAPARLTLRGALAAAVPAKEAS